MQKFKNSYIAHILFHASNMSQSSISTMALYGPKRTRKQSNPKRVKRPTVSTGLQRFLRLRGTPAGTYDITRMVNFYVKITAGQFSNDLASVFSEGIALTFSPQNIRVYQTSAVTKTIAVPNAAELSAIWDQIKIERVDLQFGLGIGTVASTSVAFNPLQIVMANDDNDTTSTVTEVQQLTGHKMWYGNSGDNSNCTMSVKPSYQRLIYYTAALSGYEPARGYVRSDYDIEHYATKLAIVIPPGTPASVAASGNLAVSAKFTFRCKNLK